MWFDPFESLMASGCVVVGVMYPLLSLIFRYNPVGEMNKMTSFRRSMPFIFLLIAIKVGFDQQAMGPNLYTLLHVNRHSSPFEIRQAFKSQSLRHHPDKAKPGSDGREFYVLKAAYDVLIDENKRDVYNLFGVEGVEFDPRLDEIQLFSNIFVLYLFWCVVVYIFTIPQSSRSGRSWCAIAGIIMMVIHSMFIFSSASLPDFLKATIISTATEYEVLLYMHSVFPVLVMSLVFLSESLYFDLNGFTLNFLEKNLTWNEELHALLKHVRLLSNKSSADKIVTEEVSKELDTNLQDIVDRLAMRENETVEAFKVYKAAGTANGTNYYGIIFIAFVVLMQMF